MLSIHQTSQSRTRPTLSGAFSQVSRHGYNGPDAPKERRIIKCLPTNLISSFNSLFRCPKPYPPFLFAFLLSSSTLPTSLEFVHLTITFVFPSASWGCRPFPVAIQVRRSPARGPVHFRLHPEAQPSAGRFQTKLSPSLVNHLGIVPLGIPFSPR